MRERGLDGIRGGVGSGVALAVDSVMAFEVMVTCEVCFRDESML